jgi:hypothetical protein
MLTTAALVCGGGDFFFFFSFFLFFFFLVLIFFFFIPKFYRNSRRLSRGVHLVQRDSVSGSYVHRYGMHMYLAGSVWLSLG